MNKSKIELKSEQIDHILGKPPHKLTKYSIGILFGLINMGVIGTMLFPYPEKIDCRFVILSSNPPIQIFSQNTGQIILNTNDKQYVKEGEIIASIHNPANLNDVLFLEESLNIKTTEDIFKLEFNALKLGDLTPAFLDFEKSIKNYNDYITIDYIPQKINRINDQINEVSERSSLLSNQIDFQSKDLELSLINFHRDSLLFLKKVISATLYEESQSNLLQKKLSLVDANVSLKNDIIHIDELEVVLLDLQTEDINQKKNLINNILNAKEILKNKIKEWKRNFVFSSPYNGFISYSTLWSNNQWVEKGDPIMTIIPHFEEKIIGRMEIPIERSGKVQIGQKVILKLSNYPYLEYGVIYGTIKTISLVPYNEKYISEIEIPNLITNYNYTIPFLQQMEGTASIITKDVSLFDRMVQPIKSTIRGY